MLEGENGVREQIQVAEGFTSLRLRLTAIITMAEIAIERSKKAKTDEVETADGYPIYRGREMYNFLFALIDEVRQLMPELENKVADSKENKRLLAATKKRLNGLIKIMDQLGAVTIPMTPDEPGDN